MNDFSLEGKVAIVTGSSSGIGRGTAKIFARYGAKVLLAARRESRLQELKAEIEAAGGIADYIVCDVSIEENCRDTVAACIEKFGRLDIVVSSAGYGTTSEGLEAEFKAEKFEKVIKTDLASVFNFIKYSYPEMAKVGGGSIITISSIAAVKGFGQVSYSAAKGGIRSMDRALASELGPMGIRINSIYPGYINTEMSAPTMANEEVHKAILAGLPMRRVGEPEDIGYCALFLASDVSGFITGQAFIVDGGQTC